MSAEPAPAPAETTAGPHGADTGATIIPLVPRTASGRRTPHRSGGASLVTQPEEEPHTTADEAILRPLAEHLELAFTAHHLTLADPRARAVFDVTMDIAAHLTRGAAAQGILDEAQRQQMVGLMEGAKRAAALLAE